MIVVRVFWSSFCLLSVKDMLKCKSILDYFKFNSEGEILDGPENHDQSEPWVSGLPDTGISCESQFVEDDTDSDRELGLDLNQHLNDECTTPSFFCLRQIHSWLRSTMANERLGNLAVLAFQGFDIQLSVDQICQSFPQKHRKMCIESIFYD